MNEDYTEEDLVANLPKPISDKIQLSPGRFQLPTNKKKVQKKFIVINRYVKPQIPIQHTILKRNNPTNQNYILLQDSDTRIQQHSGFSTPSVSDKHQKQLSIYSVEQLNLNLQNVKTNDNTLSFHQSSSNFFPTVVEIDKISVNSNSNYSAYYDKSTQPQINQSYQQQQWKYFKRQFSSELHKQKEKQLINQLVDESPEPPIKDVIKKRINGQDLPSLANHYRYLNKINDANAFCAEPISQYSSMINMSISKCQAPQKLGIVNYINQPQKYINANNYYIGDKRIDIFSVGIDSFKDGIERLNLSKNNITDKGAIILIDKISTKTYNLDLSNNKISVKACSQLVKVMTSANHCLREINLEGNKLGNAAASIIIQGCMKQGSQISKLNLSKNLLDEKLCPLLKQYISTNYDLFELYLHWNLFCSNGGRFIAEGLLENLYLKVLDISHNNLGKNIENTKVWCQVFERDNKMDLVHLDLSFNDFTYEECIIIAQSLEANHQIFGFHFQGNYGYIDLKGFLKLPEKAIKGGENENLFALYRIDGTHIIKSCGQKENCWICGGWPEKTFYWDPILSGPVNQEPIFIHFSTDNYLPHLMIKKNNLFEFTKVFPPGQKINYFFTGLGNQLVANNQPQELAQSPDIQIQFGDIAIYCMMEYLNFSHSQQNSNFFNKEHQSKYQCKPREKEINYLMPKKEKLKIVWTYEKSLFKDWKKDDQEILNNCFNTDWDCSRIERIIRNKDEIPEFKEFLRSKYKIIKDCYKSNATLAPAGEVWSISQNVFSDFVQMSQIIDNQSLFLKDSDFQFISSNSQQGTANNKNNPARQLIRYQFLEVLVRLCDDKYIKTKKCETYVQAFQSMLNDGLQNALDSIDNEQEWRDKFYWTEQSDTCLRYYKPLVDYIYRKFAGSKNNDLVKIKYLNLEEFKAFCYMYGLVSDKVTERDLNQAFNLSMMTQVDEISKSRHLQMHIIEFMEALARISDVLSPIPYGFEKEVETWPPEKLQNLDVSIKLEGLLVGIYKKISDKLLQQEFQLPEKSLFKDEITAIHEGKEQQLQGRKSIKKNIFGTINTIIKLTRMSRAFNTGSQANRKQSTINPATTISQPNLRKSQIDQQTAVGKRMSQLKNIVGNKHNTMIVTSTSQQKDMAISLDQINSGRDRQQSLSQQQSVNNRYQIQKVINEKTQEQNNSDDSENDSK